MTTSRQTKGYINGVLASVSYGTNPLFALPLYACGIGASSVLFFRYFIATLIYYFWLKFVKKISLKINIFQTNSLFGVLGNLSDWYRNILHKILGTCRKSL